MVGYADKTELRAEVTDTADALAKMAQDDDRVDDRGNQGVNLAADLARSAREDLMDHDIQRTMVEAQYTKLYLGIRQAFQSVGDQWIRLRTQGLRDDLGTVDAWDTWAGRGMNIAWAAVPATAALPVVLAGTIVDMFLDAARAAGQKDLAQREAKMHAELDKRLGASLAVITAQAAADFEAIAHDDAALTAVSSKVFKSIDAIEAVYADALRKELNALPRD
jgi:hypothetical protein